MTLAVAAVERKITQQRREAPQITSEGMRQIAHGGPIRRCFFVASRSLPGHEYNVLVFDDGRLMCQCICAHYRATCAHKRVVAAQLAEEAAAIERKQRQAEEEASRGWKLTEKGPRVLEQWCLRERAEQEHSNEGQEQRQSPPREAPATADTRQEPRALCHLTRGSVTTNAVWRCLGAHSAHSAS